MKYHVARDGQQIGVFVEYEVRQGLKGGELRGSDLYWHEGMADWKPLHSASDVIEVIDPDAEVLEPSFGSTETSDTQPLALATLSQRLSAKMMDLSLGCLCLFMLQQGEKTLDAQGVPTSSGAAWIIWGTVFALTIGIYNIRLLGTRGQTIGKKWMGIRIANHADGSNPGFVKALLVRDFLCNLPLFIIYLGLPYFLVDNLCIFRQDRRCIHDLIAGTKVVQGSLPKKQA